MVGEARRRSEADANAKAVAEVEQDGRRRLAVAGRWRREGRSGSCGTKQKPINDIGMVTLAWAAHHIRPESYLRVP